MSHLLTHSVAISSFGFHVNGAARLVSVDAETGASQSGKSETYFINE